MAKPGPAKKPYLQAVREGNPGRQKLSKGAVVAAGQLVEPEWSDLFTAVRLPAKPKKPAPGADSDEFDIYYDNLLRYETMRLLQADNRRAREIARGEWRRVIPVLVRSVGLADVDETVARDYCICVARIDMCERGLSRVGMVVLGERGWQKNGLTTIVTQYRAQLKTYIGELGLSPSSRTGIDPAGGDDDDDEASAFD